MSTPLNDPVYAGRRRRLESFIRSVQQTHIDPVDYIGGAPSRGNPCVTECGLPDFRFSPPDILSVRGGPTGVGLKEGRRSIK